MKEIILITGAGGWLGSELTFQLLEQGKKVRAFNKNLTKSLEELKRIYGDLLEIVIGDILDSEKVENAIKGVKEVYHLAAKVHFIPIDKKEEEEFYKINTEATKNIFEYCLKYNIERIIFFSSVSVFKKSDNIISEKSEKEAKTAYGKSKLKAEEIGIEFYNKYNLPITIIEPVTVYGEGDIGNFSKLENMIKKGIAISFGKQKNKKTIIYYKDLINMVINISKDKSTMGKSIICGTETITLKEIYNIIIKKQNRKVININIPQFFTDIIIKISNISILKRINRKITSLTESNEFELSQCRKYISNDKITTFEKFELQNKKVKKVLIVATVTGHINAFHIPYLKYFKEQGYEVHVASNGTQKIEYCDKHFNLPFARFPIKINNIKAYKKLKEIINDNSYEIIHCHTPVGGVLTRLAAIKARKKDKTRVIYTAHGFHFYKGAPLLNWIVYYPIEKYLSKFTDCLITINGEDYNLAKKKFKTKEIRFVNGVGIDENKFNFQISDNEKCKIRQSLDLKDDDFVIIYAAELSKRKNQEMLIKVVKQLIDKGIENIKVLLPGDDSRNGYYQQMTKELKLEHNIKFLGYRKDIPKLLKISNLYVSVAKQEGLPVNIIEAMISGLPIVATDCRGNRDLLLNQLDLIKINDYESLKNRIIYYMSNETKKTDYSIYTLDKILNEMVKIYESR